MFQDFDKSAQRTEGRGRLGVSVLTAAGLFALAGTGIGAALATVRVVTREKPVEVTFAPPPVAETPEPPPPPEPVEPAPSPEPPEREVEAPGVPEGTIERDALAAPTAIPTERPPESEGTLAPKAVATPRDGLLRGGPSADELAQAVAKTAGDPQGPRFVRERLERPRFVGGCRAPEPPEALRSQAATIQVELELLVGPDGRVTDTKLTKGHPVIPEDDVLACARAQLFEPARLPDGTAVAHPFRRRFVFKPANG